MPELTLNVLWAWPAARATLRSHFFADIRDVVVVRSRGASAAFHAARVSGDSGKLSFAHDKLVGGFRLERRR
jgi:hypothetical protein